MTRVVLSSASELEDERWRAVEERSQRDDGRFIFAVRTTGIYCRPSCSARRGAVRMSSFRRPTKRARRRIPRVSSMHADAAVSGVTEWVTKLCRRLEEPARFHALGVGRFGWTESVTRAAHV